jgi:hypothetical protein
MIGFSEEQLETVMQSLELANPDEVTNEVIDVRVRFYRDEPVLDDSGNPFCDEKGHPFTYRRAGMRTAHIQNIVPVNVYARSIAISEGFAGGTPTAEQVEAMGDLVHQVWKISEPFMTRKMLIEEGIDGDVVFGLFMRFFAKLNRPLNNKA